MDQCMEAKVNINYEEEYVRQCREICELKTEIIVLKKHIYTLLETLGKIVK